MVGHGGSSASSYLTDPTSPEFDFTENKKITNETLEFIHETKTV